MNERKEEEKVKRAQRRLIKDWIEQVEANAKLLLFALLRYYYFPFFLFCFLFLVFGFWFLVFFLFFRN